MKNIFLDLNCLHGDKVIISDENYHYLKNVRRIRKGNTLDAVIGDGKYQLVVSNVDKKSLECNIVTGRNIRSENIVRIQVFQGLLKAKKMDFVVSKLSELGVETLFPLNTSRTVPVVDSRGNRAERWRKIAVGTNRTGGWEFTVNEDLAVGGLGIFDLDDDGLYLSHEVGIWHSGELVLSATVPAGTEGLLIDDFRYIEAEPFWLTSGETYVIGATTIGDPFIGNSGSATITTLDSIIYERTLMSPNDSGFSLPTLERDYYFCGPNFLVIPEPMTVFLFGLGGLFLVRKRSM